MYVVFCSTRQGSFVRRFLLTYRNPFVDSHPVFSAPIDVTNRTLDRVEVETTPSEVTGGLISTFIRHLSRLIAHAEGPVILGLHAEDASLPDVLANCSRTVLVDVDYSADRGEMFSPFPLFPRA